MSDNEISKRNGTPRSFLELGSGDGVTVKTIDMMPGAVDNNTPSTAALNDLEFNTSRIIEPLPPDAVQPLAQGQKLASSAPRRSSLQPGQQEIPAPTPQQTAYAKSNLEVSDQGVGNPESTVTPQMNYRKT